MTAFQTCASANCTACEEIKRLRAALDTAERDLGIIRNLAYVRAAVRENPTLMDDPKIQDLLALLERAGRPIRQGSEE